MFGAYDFAGLDSIQTIRWILEVATIDTFGLDNSNTRSRPLISAAIASAKLLETGELEGRVAALELALGTAHETQAGPSEGRLLGGFALALGLNVVALGKRARLMSRAEHDRAGVGFIDAGEADKAHERRADLTVVVASRLP